MATFETFREPTLINRLNEIDPELRDPIVYLEACEISAEKANLAASVFDQMDMLDKRQIFCEAAESNDNLFDLFVSYYEEAGSSSSKAVVTKKKNLVARAWDAIKELWKKFIDFINGKVLKKKLDNAEDDTYETTENTIKAKKSIKDLIAAVKKWILGHKVITIGAALAVAAAACVTLVHIKKTREGHDDSKVVVRNRAEAIAENKQIAQQIESSIPELKAIEMNTIEHDPVNVAGAGAARALVNPKSDITVVSEKSKDDNVIHLGTTQSSTVIELPDRQAVPKEMLVPATQGQIIAFEKAAKEAGVNVPETPTVGSCTTVVRQVFSGVETFVKVDTSKAVSKKNRKEARIARSEKKKADAYNAKDKAQHQADRRRKKEEDEKAAADKQRHDERAAKRAAAEAEKDRVNAIRDAQKKEKATNKAIEAGAKRLTTKIAGGYKPDSGMPSTKVIKVGNGKGQEPQSGSKYF